METKNMPILGCWATLSDGSDIPVCAYLPWRNEGVKIGDKFIFLRSPYRNTEEVATVTEVGSTSTHFRPGEFVRHLP